MAALSKLVFKRSPHSAGSQLHCERCKQPMKTIAMRTFQTLMKRFTRSNIGVILLLWTFKELKYPLFSSFQIWLTFASHLPDITMTRHASFPFDEHWIEKQISISHSKLIVSGQFQHSKLIVSVKFQSQRVDLLVYKQLNYRSCFIFIFSFRLFSNFWWRSIDCKAIKAEIKNIRS